MAKHIGIVLALCATLAFAARPHYPDGPGYDYQNFKEHHENKNWSSPGLSSHNPHFSQNAGKWHSPQGFNNKAGYKSHGFHNQPFYFMDKPKHSSENGPNSEFFNENSITGNWPSDFPSPRTSRNSEENESQSFPEPQSQNNFDDLKNLPWYPKYPYITEGWQQPGFPQQHAYYGFPQGNMPEQYPPTFGNQYWGRKVNRPDWCNPHFPQIPKQVNGLAPQMPQQVNGVFDMSKRRPLFIPIYPYHFYPYAHPSSNEEEFQTIEARSLSRNARDSQEDSSEVLYQERGHDHHHGSHNPNWNENSDKEWPFHHGHNPHFNPSPNVPEESDEIPIFSSEDAQPYELPSPPFGIDEEHFNIPNILEIIEHWLHEHVKPHLPHHKPEEDSSEDIEGSGDEDIIPLSGAANVPLIEENLGN